MRSKVCKMCKENLPTGEFYKNSRREDGLHYYCKTCCLMHRRLEAIRKREYIAKRQYNRAVVEGIEADVSITLTELYRKFKGVCALCNAYVPPGEASIDHKHPIGHGGAHVWENVQLVHVKCNYQKGIQTHNAALKLPEWKRKRKWRENPFERKGK